MDVKRRFKISLLEANPELAKEFDSIKNNITPDKVSCSNHSIKYYWVCSECTYSWRTTIYHRHYSKSGCPCCKNHVCVPEINSLAVIRPDLLDDWHPTKNLPLTPEMVTSGETTIVWWKCKACKHEWNTPVRERGKSNYGCKMCNRGYNSSFPEKVVFFYIKKVFSSALNDVKTTNGARVDVLIEDYNIVIEYDGFTWHKDKYLEDRHKNHLLSNYLFIRIREQGLHHIEDFGCINISVAGGSETSLVGSITKIFDIIKFKTRLDFKVPDINIDRDRLLIREFMSYRAKKNSLAEKRPDLLKEWDYSSNGSLSPYDVSQGSREKIIWKCSTCNNPYPARVSSRVSSNTNCPFCSNQKVQIGYNDLYTTEPLIAIEWLNCKSTLTPHDITRGSREEVLWKCSICSNTFFATVSRRTSSDARDCSSCKRKIIIVGKLLFNNQTMGVRFLFGRRFCDVDINLLKEKGFDFNLTAVPEMEIRLINNKWTTGIEHKKRIHVREIKETDIFFSRLKTHIANNGQIPIQSMEDILNSIK